MRYEFKGKVTLWAANPKFFLVALPKKHFKEISELASIARRGFGSVKVSVVIGQSAFRTSIFPSSEGTYEMPVKASVRKAEGIEEGSTIFVQLELVDF